MTTDVTDPATFARHTAYSDPGAQVALVQALSHDVDELCATSRNLVAHYRAELSDLLPERRGEIDTRWVEAMLELDQSRHTGDLTIPRPSDERIAGCCRDHSLLLTSFLRTQGVPARTVVGFAGYFAPPFHHDHVVVEWHTGRRWVRTDPELEAGSFDFDVRDLPTGPGAPFETAAEAWLQYRNGTVDADQYGVDPAIGPPLRGSAFLADYVVFQVAHRYGDELLLWDDWFAAPSEGQVDRLAALLVAADAGDADAERTLYAWYRSDPNLHPGERIRQHSPYGTPTVQIDMVTRSVLHD